LSPDKKKAEDIEGFMKIVVSRMVNRVLI